MVDNFFPNPTQKEERERETIELVQVDTFFFLWCKCRHQNFMVNLQLSDWSWSNICSQINLKLMIWTINKWNQATWRRQMKKAIRLGVAIRVRESGSCCVKLWVFSYIGWLELDLFSKRVRNPHLEHNLFSKQVDPTQHI